MKINIDGLEMETERDIDVNMLREMIDQHIKATEKYGEYLESIKPMFPSLDYPQLIFFNKGYKFAMEKILDVLKESE